jgi:cytochrome b6-f complex iron-sulfur subunit
LLSPEIKKQHKKEDIMTTINRHSTVKLTPSPQSIAQDGLVAPSRREFLNYIWMASMVLLAGELTAGLLWFAMPRFKDNEFGGSFAISPDDVPLPVNAPNLNTNARFWLSYTDRGLIALYVVCTHLGCLYKWVDSNFRFECPCHGSKYELDGLYIEGPAPRSLDRFHTTLVFTDGTTATSNEQGDPIPIDGREIAEITVDTGNRILRDGKV